MTSRFSQSPQCFEEANPHVACTNNNRDHILLALLQRELDPDKKIGELGSGVFSLSCQVDGFLESKSTFRAQSILEAKALRQLIHEPNVYWQETKWLALLNAHPEKSLPKDRTWVSGTEGTRQPHLPGLRCTFLKRNTYLIIKKEDAPYFAKLALAVALRTSKEGDERI
ncbi:unnamed protein product [Penicillium roqueforti FM164]|uniref:Genomic scaffold, ProqFM164S02 n=1 Tax=Penicillium roqueforti (strain FM164) TaxID=1365484 RepID=W6Q7V4_PENRF|nr:unnamed protein product [Penicillium roqueforti FM164]